MLINIDKWEDCYRKLPGGDTNLLWTTKDNRTCKVIKKITGVKEIKNGEVPAPDDTLVNLIKYILLAEKIVNLMNKCFDQLGIPKQWKVSYISYVYEKWGKEDANNCKFVYTYRKIRSTLYIK